MVSANLLSNRSALDPIDHHILSLVQRDGRMPQHEIAKQVGLSQPAVADRLRKLEERGVITGYVALVDASKLGKDITAFVGVTIEHPRFFENFARRIQALPEVLECHRVAGEFSYLLKVRTESTGMLDRLLTRQLRAIAGVSGTHTTIALSSLKEITAVHLDLPEGSEEEERR